MAKFSIYSKDSQSVRHTGEPQYCGSYMGVDYIEFRSISSPIPIPWEIGDYLDYERTGLRYKLYGLPMPKKVARKSAYGASFEYSNVQLFAPTKELEIAPFRDLVTDDNRIHFSTRPEVATYENVHGIARRIQACMDDLYPGKWRIEVIETDDEDLNALLDETKEFSVSNGSCIDALAQIYELWKNVGWIYTYDSENDINIITIGKANIRTSDNTTDVLAYGLGKGLTSIKKASANADQFATRLYVYGSERNIQTRYYNGFDIVDKDSVDIRNLMIPMEKWGKTDGLPDARKAYLQAEDEIVEKYGLIPKNIYFDGSEHEEIYPSIVGLTCKKVREAMIEAGEEDSVYLPPITDDRIDRVKSAYGWGDGSKEDTEEFPTFTMYIRQVGFDIAAQGRLTSEGHATISMKSGMCAGREFKVKAFRFYIDNNQPELELEKAWDDSIGMAFPNTYYPITEEDEFVLLDIPMPDYYIKLAEDRLYEAAEKLLADYTRVSAFYEPGMDPMRVNATGKKISAGMYMQVYDEDIVDTADNKDYVLIDTITIDEKSNPPLYSVTLREQKRASRSFGTLEDMIEDAKELSKEGLKKERQYTERRFRSAQETLVMLQAAFKNFSEGISPVTVKTMAMLVGDESLQFIFSNSRNSLVPKECPLYYDNEAKTMKASASALIHMTLGITDVTPARVASDYMSWNIPQWESKVLDDPSLSYYVYAKVSKTGSVNEYSLEPSPMEMDAATSYYFLVGILNSEHNGSRDFVELYGFTEVLPGRIVTDLIRSADGRTYFDLATGRIGGDISFLTSGGQSKNMSDFATEVQDQIDGVVENWSAEGHPYIDSFPVSEWATDAEKIAHINDTYVNIEAYVDDESTPTAGQAWRWCQCAEGTTSYFEIEKEVTSTNWEKIGKIDPNAPYTVVQTRRNGAIASTMGMTFDTDILVVSGPPVYIKVEKATGDVYVKDASGYFVDYYPVQLRFIYTGYVSVTDKDGNTINLHWHPIADSDAVKALREVSDMSYLKDTFAKGETNISGGVVMSNMVAVKDEDGSDIGAFMNGSDFASDTEHGKLMHALGIPQTTEDGDTNLEARAKESKTRMYEDGHIESNDLTLRKGCKIGDDMRLGDNNGAGYIEMGEHLVSDDWMRISEGSLNSHSKSYHGVLQAISMSGCSGHAMMISVGGNAFSCDPRNVDVGLEVDAPNAWAHCVPRGVFAGLRPKTRVITTPMTASSPNVLDKFDFSVLVNATGGVYNIALPASPLDGQEYVIESLGADIRVSSSNEMWIHREGGSVRTKTFSGSNSIRLKYYKDANIWTCTWLDSYSN